MEERITEVTQLQAKKLIGEVMQSNTMLEGRANAFTVDLETKMQTQIN